MDTATAPPAPLPPRPAPPTDGPARARARRAWRIAASCAAALGLVWAATEVASVLAHEERTEVTGYDAAGVSTLDVRIDDGSLTVVAADTDRITVTARITDGLRAATERQELDGDRLVLRGGCPALFTTFCGVSYTVEVPERLAVTARLGDDDITLTGVRGDLDLASDDGRVEVRGSGTGVVVLRSGNASIVGTDLRATEVDARSDNGSTSLTFADPPRTVEARSSNGDVTVLVPDDRTSYAVDTGSANAAAAIGVRTDPEGERRIVARSGNGDVLVAYRT